MQPLDLQLSAIEIGFLLSCHVSAMAALSLVALPPPALAAIAIAILLSLGRLLRAWYRKSRGQVDRVQLGQMQTMLQLGAEQVYTSPPEVHYLGEYLIVLSFEPIDPSRAGRRIYLAFYPDTLSRIQDWQLRRYLLER